jgi:hypothetical protein
MSDIKVRLQPPTQNLTLKNTTINVNRLDNLADVREPDAAKFDGSVLVYDADTDLYVLTKIFDYNPTTNKYTLNGGSF